MKLVTLILFNLSAIFCCAQQRPINITFSYGSYTGPSYATPKAKNYYQFSFNYDLRDKWSISSGFTAGQFNYRDTIRSNTDEQINSLASTKTNSKGFDFHAHAVLHYAFINKSKFRLLAGAGVGILIQRLKFPYREPCSSGCAVFVGETSSTRLELPLNTEAYYLIENRVGIGITSGCFLDSNFSILGLHIGPQIRVKL